MNDKSFKNKFQLIIDLCKKNNFPVENFEKELLLWSKTKEDYVKYFLSAQISLLLSNIFINY